ncbi:hypothetical protein HHL22_20455 [Hymenobacter sp. RP-2-7]|uniref:Uncharacterized protein n=1 Tax=Hymenobacter polaris TaxID=2682546 RepID=A0A7Y0AHP5_9BACT|nr:hypothetical protein [Hymenobacter polaris]NML67579.1 hypothetical protein [Hymenobacter polaris]
MDSAFVRATYSFVTKENSIANERFIILALDLQKTSHELERVMIKLGQGTETEMEDVYSAIINIWNVINISHKMFNLNASMGIIFKDNALKRVERVTRFAHAYENLDKLVASLFLKDENGESVLGDFTWRYKEKNEDTVITFFHKGGSMRGEGRGIIININQDITDMYYGRTGIHNLTLLAYEQSGNGDFVLSSIDIDDIIYGLTELIHSMNTAYSKLENQLMRTEVEGESLMQSIGMFRFVGPARKLDGGAIAYPVVVTHVND